MVDACAYPPFSAVTLHQRFGVAAKGTQQEIGSIIAIYTYYIYIIYIICIYIIYMYVYIYIISFEFVTH